MMKKILITALTGLALLGSASVFAKSDSMVLQDAAKNVVSIAKAKTLADETAVTLTGSIVKHISGDDFELKDSSGSIVIDVDDNLWKPMQLKAGDKVRVVGEIDTHRKKPTDIEVIKIQKIK